MRNSKYFLKPKINTVKYGEISLQYLGTKLWDQLPRNIQELVNIEEFKIFIKTWRPKKCPCEICKVYIRGVGYVEISNQVS